MRIDSFGFAFFANHLQTYSAVRFTGDILWSWCVLQGQCTACVWLFLWSCHPNQRWREAVDHPKVSRLVPKWRDAQDGSPVYVPLRFRAVSWGKLLPLWYFARMTFITVPCQVNDETYLWSVSNFFENNSYWFHGQSQMSNVVPIVFPAINICNEFRHNTLWVRGCATLSSASCFSHLSTCGPQLDGAAFLVCTDEPRFEVDVRFLSACAREAHGSGVAQCISLARHLLQVSQKYTSVFEWPHIT